MQISSNYSMNGVPYENRRRQNDDAVSPSRGGQL